MARGLCPGLLHATQRANKLFRQYLSQYAIDRRTRIPLSKVWLIKRYSDAAPGDRLLARSFRRGLLRLGIFGLLAARSILLLAAWLSVSEEWDTVRLSDGHSAAAHRVVFSPDGRRIVSVGEDNRVIVWDLERRERIATLTDQRMGEVVGVLSKRQVVCDRL